MNEEEIEQDELEKELETKPNPCVGCPVWEDWRSTLAKKKQRIPHSIDGIEECEICSYKGGTC
jgi:hypothetical protein